MTVCKTSWAQMGLDPCTKAYFCQVDRLGFRSSLVNWLMNQAKWYDDLILAKRYKSVSNSSKYQPFQELGQCEEEK